ncbi:hypothetical protein [Rhodoferax sp. WC2427]|uniref:hypothetical protein n=1 Tax=Rhodoferax sp. WC2427 TaxID=3234144 RepID=UPI0034668D70
MTLEQQKDNLRRMARTGILRGFTLLCATATLGALVGGLLTRHPVYGMVAGVAGVLWYAAHSTRAHIQHAAQALDLGATEPGRVHIEITCWSDSDTYLAKTAGTRSGTWQFPFIPQGWVPQAGAFDATCFLLPGLPWPALVLVDGNICHPRETPKRVA